MLFKALGKETQQKSFIKSKTNYFPNLDTNL